MIIVTDSPQKNRFISDKERQFISDSAGNSSNNTEVKVSVFINSI
jgi:hypothetical protein